MAHDSLPMMPFFVRDYIAATRHMTLEQRGAYTDLLFFQWDLGSLPDNPVELARMLGASVEHFSSIWPSIAGKFKTQNGTLKNLRVEIERKNAKKLKKSNTTKAKIAANARWNKGKGNNAPSMRQAMLEDCPPSPSPSEESESREKPTAAPSSVRDLRKELFDLGVSLLGEKYRGLIGKAVAIHGEQKIGELLGGMAARPPVDPVAYFAKATAARDGEKRFMTA